MNIILFLVQKGNSFIQLEHFERRINTVLCAGQNLRDNKKIATDLKLLCNGEIVVVAFSIYFRILKALSHWRSQSSASLGRGPPLPFANFYRYNKYEQI
jgi:hypothetical protein